MVNLERVIRFYLEENRDGNIYFDDELIEFKEFYEIFKSMDLEIILEKDEQTWYLLKDDGVWSKVSVKSLDELDEEGEKEAYNLHQIKQLQLLDVYEILKQLDNY